MSTSEASNTASGLDKWAGLTPFEFHLIHHALRMLAKLPGDDSEPATHLADEMWERHCNTSDFVRDSGKRS